MTTRILSAIGLLAAFAGISPVRAVASPQTDDVAPAFALNTLDGKSVELKQLITQKPVLLVVLRGWPGYQCPNCTRQVHDFVMHAADFADQNVQVVMVYPGPAAALMTHAQTFLKDKAWPKEFLFVVDPDYTFTNTYGLRWEAKGETAYPSTFIIDQAGKVRFAKISQTHGGRLSATAALDAVRASK
ncbi:MAG: peroxiredoxin family protein [Opitutaceae bacterium]